MKPAERLELALAARADVAHVISLLQRPTPQTLDQSAASLNRAITRMEQLQTEFTAAPVACPAKPVIAALRKDLRRISLLLRHAWALRIGGSGQSGYTSRGELASQAPARALHWALEA